MNEEDKQQQQQDMEMVKKCLVTLGEHFDTVHIFATRHEPVLDGTVNIQCGVGNWYARYGQIHDWTIKEDEVAREKVRTEPLI